MINMILMTLEVADIQKVLTIIVDIIGGAVAIIGGIDALSGYSNQSSGKMQEGIIRAVGGAGIIVLGSILIPKMFEGITL